MSLLHRGRLLMLIIRELAQKYTKALALGFISGLVLSIGFWRLLPFIRSQWLTPTDRIAMVGDFTPATLPLAIQEEISEGLTTIGSDGTVEPGLATSWTATDSGKTFLFTLRDATWQSGKKLTASDINYNIRNVTFSALDSRTLRADLKAPYSPFPAVVAKPLFRTGLDGIGTYKVTNIRLNGNTIVTIRLTPVKENTGRVLEYHFYRTESDAIMAYKLGEVNSINDLSSPEDLTTWGKTEVTKQTRYTRIVSLYFNMSNSAVSDRSFRQALAYASPVRSDVVRADSPISKLSWAYTAKVKDYPYDLTQARKLLGTTKEGSASAHLTISTFAPYLDDAQSIANSWTSVGVATDVRVISSVPSDFEVLLSAQDLPPDPDQYPFWHSTQTDTNITNYANVKIDKLLEDGRQEMDVAKREAIYADFQRYLTEDVPAIFLYYPNDYTVLRR